MFRELFRTLEENLPSLQAACVVGRDGIEIDGHVRADLPHEVLSAEMNGLLRNLERLEEEFSLGTTTELVIRTEAQNILLAPLSKDLFLLVITEPSATTGEVRYQVQRVAYRFLEILS